MKNIGIIGAGFSSLSAAAHLASKGYKVEVFEKHSGPGGRARLLIEDGYTFDMGPTWYWMPDIFDDFFKQFGRKREDYYSLELLSPCYRVQFKDQCLDIYNDREKLKGLFEELEPGAGKALDKFLDRAERNYRIAIDKMVQKPGYSPLELVTPETVRHVGLFLSNIRTYIHKRFKHPYLRQILEFPVLFLGAKPSNTPAFYNFMNHADLTLGTWYPKGGMHEVARGIERLCKELGVEFHYNADVTEIVTEHEKVKGLNVNGEIREFDLIVSGADYNHTESLLKREERQYSNKYWEKKTFAPSALLFYLGFDTKIENVIHHTLYFDESFDAHAKQIYDHPQWPEKPLFYCSFPTVSEPGWAPEGHEAVTVLIPLAAGLDDSVEERERCLNIIMDRLEQFTGQELKGHLKFKRSYAVKDFIEDYNSYKGNAYGLANTLRQTAFLRPSLKSSKVKNLVFTGQLTVPGPGVPPCLISGGIAARAVEKCFERN